MGMNVRLRPMTLVRQYLIACCFGACAAAMSIVAGTIATLDPSAASGVLIAVALAVPIGGATGAFSFAAGRTAWRLTSRITTNTSISALCGCVVVGAIGTAISWFAFSGSVGWTLAIALAPSVLLSCVGALGFYLYNRARHSQPGGALRAELSSNG
jgi:hypothetical protein